jgi:hypothetical protein
MFVRTAIRASRIASFSVRRSAAVAYSTHGSHAAPAAAGPWNNASNAVFGDVSMQERDRSVLKNVDVNINSAEFKENKANLEQMTNQLKQTVDTIKLGTLRCNIVKR